MPLLRENAEAFPTLSAAELALVEAHGTRRSVAVGDYLFHQGDETSDFYVVVSGAADIVLHTDGIDQVIVQHGPGSFAGELNLVTGLRLLFDRRSSSNPVRSWWSRGVACSTCWPPSLG